MSEPDEAMVEAAALALFAIDYPNTDWHDGISADMHEDFRGYARAVLSVPVVRDALARDAQVREIVAGMEPDPNDYSFLREWAAFDEIAALYPSPGDRDDSEEAAVMDERRDLVDREELRRRLAAVTSPPAWTAINGKAEWRWLSIPHGKWLPFPEGTLNLETGQVAVRPKAAS